MGFYVQVSLLTFVSLLFHPELTRGDQLTIKEFGSMSKLLEDEVKRMYGSDAQDLWSDLVTQEVKNNKTFYHRGDATQPVFISGGKDKVGKPVVIMERGADYIVPEDRNTFVVLRQKGGGKDYNVHTAVFFEMGPNKKIVVWEDVRIEQLEKSGGALTVMGNRYLPRPSPTDLRPRCDWVGSVLFCNARKTLKSPVRKFAPPPKQMKPSKFEATIETSSGDEENAELNEVPTDGADENEGEDKAEEAVAESTDGGEITDEVSNGITEEKATDGEMAPEHLQDGEESKAETLDTATESEDSKAAESPSENAPPEEGEVAANGEGETEGETTPAEITVDGQSDDALPPTDDVQVGEKVKGRYIRLKDGNKGRGINRRGKGKSGRWQESIPINGRKKFNKIK